MDPVTLLSREFLAQDFSAERLHTGALDRYRLLADGYAQLENQIAVLSDLHANVSYIRYGGFAARLGLERPPCEEVVASIWEEKLFRLIHPDDLAGKHVQELRFFDFVQRQPRRLRTDYYLASRLRMRTPSGGYLPVLHRLFYIPAPSRKSLWLALCLYGPQVGELPAPAVIVRSTDGSLSVPERQRDGALLTERERQVLELVDRGMMSKEIAAALSVSIHTVSRHRQDILSRLRVKSSIEACRMARELGIL